MRPRTMLKNSKNLGVTGFLQNRSTGQFFQVLSDHLKPGDVKIDDSDIPLTSKLIEEDPEYKEVVIKFVNSLPGKIEEIFFAYDSQDWQALSTILHDLKGLGGGFGYPEVTELAARMEFEVKKGGYDELAGSLVELKTMITRMMNSIPQD